MNRVGFAGIYAYTQPDLSGLICPAGGFIPRRTRQTQGVFLTTTLLFIVLFILVLTSLALNVGLIVYGLRIRGQLMGLRETVRHMLAEAITDLGSFGDLSLRYDIPVKDSLPVNAHIPLKEQMNITVKGSIPVNQVVQTTVTITASPFGIKVPLDVEVPLNINVPIDITLPVTIDHNLVIDTDVPIDLNVPIHIELGKTELTDFVDQVVESLKQLEELIG